MEVGHDQDTIPTVIAIIRSKIKVTVSFNTKCLSD